MFNSTEREIPQWSVIYEFDIERSESVKPHQPPHLRRLWTLTEGDESYQYSYIRENGKHRKYCAILTPSELAEFVDHCAIFPEDVETMGCLGAPGCGFALAPAISFRSDDPDVISKGAFVTPLGVEVETRQVCIDGELDKLWRFDIPAPAWGDETPEPILFSRLGASHVLRNIREALIETFC